MHLRNQGGHSRFRPRNSALYLAHGRLLERIERRDAYRAGIRVAARRWINACYGSALVPEGTRLAT